MDRNRIIAEAIKTILDQKGWSVDFIENETPKGFMVEVSKILPQNLPFGTTSNDISNYLNKGDRKNRVAVIEIIRSLYSDNVDNVQLSAFPPQQTLPTQQPLEDTIYRIVNEVIDKRIAEFTAPVMNEHKLELVPDPETITGEGQGRRLKRQYDRVSITVDKNLWKLFRKQQRELNCTAPRLMDSILWNLYGRPPMTYDFEY